jgi:ketosteroid isomerase-like protein
MSRENVELARRSLGAFNESGFAGIESTLDRAVVFDQSRSPFPDAGVYRGIDEVRQWFAGLTDAFGEFHYEIERTQDLGEQVAALLRVRGRGPSSGIDVSYSFVALFTVRGGKVVRMDRFSEWEEALEAARHSTSLGLVRSILARWETGDYSADDWAAADIVFTIADGPAPGDWRGLAGMAEGWRAFLGSWETLRGIVEAVRPIDADRVLVLNGFSGRGKASGLEVDHLHAATVFHLRSGKVTRLVVYFDRGNAFGDLGVPDEA